MSDLQGLWRIIEAGAAPPEKCRHPECDELACKGLVYCGASCAMADIRGAYCWGCEDAEQSDGRPGLKEGFHHPTNLCAKCEEKAAEA
jgi:hypothetical protein